MKDKPLVSIVIPVYNGSNYMREAIDSALAQTYENCEVLVINDGSTDGGKTESIALSYGDRIRYYHKENGGVATAVNLGIQKMRGEYFSWLSHDDLFFPDKIEKQMDAVFESNFQKTIVHGNFVFFDMNKDRKTEVNFTDIYEKEQLENSCFAPVFLAIHGSTVLIHKSHFDRVGLYRTELLATQDSEFLFRVMRGQKSAFVESPLIIGRLHDEQGQKTMACHKPEYNQMFVNFCEALSKEEKKEMCGSVLGFYYQLWLLLRNMKPAGDILTYLERRIEGEKEQYGPGNEYNAKKEIFPEIEDETGNIYIFGAGNFGKYMLMTLKSYGCQVSGFLDNSEKKQNTLIEGEKCYSPYDIENIEENTVVIISMESHVEEVRQQLKKMNAKHILTIQQVKKRLFGIIPKKIFLDGLEEAKNEMEKQRA